MIEKRKSTETSQSAKRAENGLWETAKVVVQALLIALVVRTFLFQPFNIPSGSMIPTLLVGDYLFVSKYSYGYSRYSFPLGLPLFKGRIFSSPPKRGDIAVFKLPSDPRIDYIKRVIGLPGDRIQMKLGRLYINGVEVPEKPIKPINVRVGDEIIKAPAYRETLPGGVTHTIVMIDNGQGEYDNTGVYKVPPGHYFMMGDNRDDSEDSRVSPSHPGGVGYVPLANFVGRSEILFFSVRGNAWEFWKWPWTVRWDRIFKLTR